MRLNIARYGLVVFLGATSVLSAQDSRFRPDRQQSPTPGCLNRKGAWEGGSAPCTQNEHDSWLADIRHWRDERKIRIGYNGSRYDTSELKGTESRFFQPQMIVEDRYFH